MSPSFQQSINTPLVQIKLEFWSDGFVEGGKIEAQDEKKTFHGKNENQRPTMNMTLIST